MNTFNFPLDGKISRTDALNENSSVTVVYNATPSDFDRYTEHLVNLNYIPKQSYDCGFHKFASFYDGENGAFLNFFEGTKEIYIVVENGTRYFDFTDNPLELCTKSSITQIHLEDFGMSYVCQLSDGRFILIDGGWEFEPESDSLYGVLKKYSPHEKPIIAAWILTHPHCDHFHAFLTFSEKYKNDAVVEKVLYNFPEWDDIAHFTKICSEGAKIPLLTDAVNRVGADVFTTHTGQIFKIGDAVCQILASFEDVLHKDIKNLNAASLIIRMELCGQVILFTGDASCEASSLAEKYGEYLKSDILQIPHHGFGCGDPSSEIAAYDLIKPSVCLLPVSDDDAYTAFCSYVSSTEYIMRDLGIDEMITGDLTKTITLPYTASKFGKRRLEADFLSGKDNAGSRTWVFTGLFTDASDDTVFTVLNMTHNDAVIFIDVIFEDPSRNIKFIKATVRHGSMKKLRVFDSESIDGDALYFNSASLKKRGVPEKAEFSIRFKSNVPVIISNNNRKAAYYSINR